MGTQSDNFYLPWYQFLFGAAVQISHEQIQVLPRLPYHPVSEIVLLMYPLSPLFNQMILEQ